MQRALVVFFMVCLALLGGGMVLVAGEGQTITHHLNELMANYWSILDSWVSGIHVYWEDIELYITENWLGLGSLFTMLARDWFWKIFLGIITVVPLVFFLHYLIIGPKHFDHDGEKVFFFSHYARMVHLVVAITFSLLVLTGLIMVLALFYGGGPFVLTARYIHLISAMLFAIPCVLMFFIWAKDSVYGLHDIKWFLIMGGYLSKSKKPVPAGKYNAGQKTWFWLATVGGIMMCYSGYVIWGMVGTRDTVRLFTIVHNVLGMGLVAFYFVHVYMCVWAIAGSLESMKTGYKPKEEVDIMHSLYKY